MVSGGRKREAGRRRAARGPQAASSLAAGGAHPRSRVLVWHSSFSHRSSRALEAVRAHALNQQLELCLPGGATGRELAEALRWETSFYYELRAPVALLLSPAFVRDYVLQGSVYMVAKNLPVDGASSAALLPSGELLLLVDRETYEQLGLVGAKYGTASPIKATSAASRGAQRFLISLDLKSPALAAAATDTADAATPATPSFCERVARVLSTRLQPLEMFLCAYNERGATCTVTFEDDDAVQRTRRELNGSLATLEGVFVPRLDVFLAQFGRAVDGEHSGGDRFRMGELREGLAAAQDWLGLVACRLTPILQRELPDEYVSRFTGQSDALEYEEGGAVACVRWRGLIAAELCESLLERVRQQVKVKRLPWAAVSVWGFPDALVSWKQQTRAARKSAASKSTHKQAEAEARAWVSREHGFLENGSNNYTIVLLPDDEYFLLQTLGPHDATA